MADTAPTLVLAVELRLSVPGTVDPSRSSPVPTSGLVERWWVGRQPPATRR